MTRPRTIVVACDHVYTRTETIVTTYSFETQTTTSITTDWRAEIAVGAAPSHRHAAQRRPSSDRHDFVTRVRRAGGGIDAIAMLLGHSTLAMATRYAHIEDPLLRAAVRAVQPMGAAPENVVDLASRRDG